MSDPVTTAPQHTLRDDVEAALRTVFDPEIPVNIYDLGLVYEIKIGDKGEIKITMTLTAPACPAAGFPSDCARSSGSIPVAACAAPQP